MGALKPHDGAGIEIVADGAAKQGVANSAAPAVYEWLLVGAGITGVYGIGAVPPQQRSGVLVIEQQERVGGLWAQLPRWQTVQNDPIDFCTEGFTTRKKVWTADDVCHLLEMKIKVQGLAPYIKTGHKLEGYVWSEEDQHWVCQVTRLADGARLQILSKRLLLGTGKHARPLIPEVQTDGSVTVLHSSQIADLGILRGKKVAVVGAGASAIDLCMHSLQHGAEGKVEWILREPRHFSGISFNTLWPMILVQLLYWQWLAYAALNLIVTLVVYGRHLVGGTLSWMPGRWYDVRYEQLVPGRGYLVSNKRRVSRRAGTEVSRIEGGALHLTNGDVIEGVDFLLMGTGYAPPERPAGFERPQNFAGFLPTGPHRGRLWLMGEDLLDTTAATPFVAYMLAIVYRALADDPDILSKLADAPRPADGADALGRPRLLNAMDVFVAVAPLARGLFPWYVWRVRMLGLYLYYRLVHKTVVFFPNTVIKTGMNLDKMERATELVAVVAE